MSEQPVKKSSWRKNLPETSRASLCFDCGSTASFRTEHPQRDERTFGFYAFDKACEEHVYLLKQPVVDVLDVSEPKR